MSWKSGVQELQSQLVCKSPWQWVWLVRVQRSSASQDCQIIVSRLQTTQIVRTLDRKERPKGVEGTGDTCYFGFIRISEIMRLSNWMKSNSRTSFDLSASPNARLMEPRASSSQSFRFIAVLPLHRSPSTSSQSFHFIAVLPLHRSPSTSSQSFLFIAVLPLHRSPSTSSQSLCCT
jgi:hypothetical protein